MIKSIRIVFALFLLATVYGLSTASFAEVPRLITYQGRLTDSADKPLTGTHDITFLIYDAQENGNLLWTEKHAGVNLTSGLFNIILGSITPFDKLDFNSQYYLSIQVDTDQEMSPRQQLTSVGYAITAENADKIKASDNDVEYGYLADKIDNNSIKINPETKKIYSVPPPTSSNRQFFAKDGMFIAPTDITTVFVTMIGGGAGGGSGNSAGFLDGGGGGGGTAGGFLSKIPCTVTPGNNYRITVGGGGIGGTVNLDNAANGGPSSFACDNMILTVNGGVRGRNGYITLGAGAAGIYIPAEGNASGRIGGGMREIPSGGTASSAPSGFSYDPSGGAGAGCFTGKGGNGGITNTTQGENGTGYGSGGGGGGGGGGAAAAGGNGTPGFVLIEW